jgi:hypothetical protein
MLSGVYIIAKLALPSFVNISIWVADKVKVLVAQDVEDPK